MFPGISGRRPVYFPVVLLLLLCLSAVMIVRQGRRILSLEAALANSQAGELASGTPFGSLQVRDLTGKVHSIEFGGKKSKPTVLYFFRPACVWCKRNSANLALLANRMTDKYDFVGVSLVSQGVEDFVRREDIRFPVYTDVSASDRTIYRLGTTPETIVLSPDGKVLRSWTGAFTRDPVRSEVEQFFSVRFPPNEESSLLN
jgi:peroxiredoxin